MGCGCGGSKYVPPERAAARARGGQDSTTVVTDPNHPGNFWNGPQPRKEPVAPAPKEQ